MSTTVIKRKRAKKACLPCHQRKRKCDTQYPCDMCTTYEYECKYADTKTNSDSNNHNMAFAAPPTAPPTAPPPAKRVAREGIGKTARFSGSADKTTARYAGASAATVFPHIVGLDLGSDSAPTIRPLAFNFGTRPDEAASSQRLLDTLISEDDMALFSGVFFAALGQVCDFQDPRIFAQRCHEYYHGSGSVMAPFGTLAAGVAALGSFLSLAKQHPREADLVQYAKDALDDPASMRNLQIDHIIAWAMRVLYLRATARPNVAWMASCTLMHLCEAVGLHDEDNIKSLASAAGAAALGHDADRLRRVFWISWAGHSILSYEHDRSAVHFRSVTCQSVIPTSSSVADEFIRIAQIIPSPNSPFHLQHEPPTWRDELFERLKAIDKVTTTHPFLIVTKADVAFCFYRRIHQLNMGVSHDMIQLVIQTGNAAVEAAKELISQGRLFWNVIGSVFQYTCVLFAMDVSAASVHIPATLTALETLVEAADTALTREALSVARRLLGLYTAKKRNELSPLERLESSYQPAHRLQEAEAMTTNALDVDWDIDWDQFLFEPYLSMLGSDVQL